MSRYETYLRKIAGEDVDISNMPEPSDRYEYYLKQIAQGGASAGMIADAYDATSTYSKDDLCTHEGKLYKAKQDIGTAEEWDATHWDETTLADELGSVDPEAIAEAVADWLAEHVDPDTGYVIDDTFSIPGAAPDSKKTGEELNSLKSAIHQKLGYTETTTPTITYTDGKTLSSATATYGEVQDSTSYSISQEIEVGTATKCTGYYSGSDTYGRLYFYDENHASQASTGKNLPAKANATEWDIPAWAKYIRFTCMTSRKNVTVSLFEYVQGEIDDELETKLDINQGAGNAGKTLAIDEDGDIVPVAVEKAKPVYMKSNPLMPLMPEFMSHFWGSMRLPSAWTSKNVVMTVSGNAGDEELTVSAILPDTLAVADLENNGRVCGLLSTDNGASFTVCNFWYKTATTLSVYPPLAANVTNATLSTFMYDSGRDYVGLHLTENGYKAYMQYLYSQDPKHCEISKYIAAFKPDLSTTDTSPFTWYGSDQITPAAYRFSTVNVWNEWFSRPTQRAYTYTLSTSYTPHTTKSGAYWEQDLKGQSGYLEAYVFAIEEGYVLPEGQELHVVVTIDGVEKLNTTISDCICRRIIVDYEKANTGKIEVYSNKWYPINNDGYGFGFGRVTWWVNELEYGNQPMFPKGATIAQEFDSWGVFHDGASGVEMERLHNAATGVSVPYENHSKGDQTSAWGKAWFYENVWKYNPAIGIFDFVINDTNSVGSGLPDTILGPDDVAYDNKLTSDEYAANMKLLAQLAVSNGIQPIFMRNCQHGQTGYKTFTFALIDALSEELS